MRIEKSHHTSQEVDSADSSCRDHSTRFRASIWRSEGRTEIVLQSHQNSDPIVVSYESKKKNDQFLRKILHRIEIEKKKEGHGGTDESDGRRSSPWTGDTAYTAAQSIKCVNSNHPSRNEQKFFQKIPTRQHRSLSLSSSGPEKSRTN